ncbi:hypothetical protein [Cellulosimicrobium composti]|uniref:Uncharacterized protein n=1 Tax=Cellulosimicrobium composti TaxID=2672572 RepID=A0ABX0BC87_9MICO|nr:hypothetical protein [Cellulosimicrobium composti]NDO89171.1 hypothetical protein [Cellulosimicrobium composti]
MHRFLRGPVVLLAALTLAGCGLPRVAVSDASSPSPGPEERVTVDGGLSLVVPDGWEPVGDELPDGVVFAATAADDDEQQLIVWAGDAEVGSEDTMLSVAVGIARQGGVCERLHDDTTFGAPRPVVDCSFATPGAPRKVLVGVAGGERSAMVLAQLDGEDLADTAAVLGPFLDAVAWT